jgi:hypothetical protein
MLRSAFDLPFAVSYPTRPFFSAGSDTIVSIRLRNGISPYEIARTAAVLERFVQLANAGGLAGRAIEPWRSGVATHSTIAAGPVEVSFRLERCLFDDASLLALCDLFLHKDNVTLVQAIDIGAGAPVQRLICDRASYSTYPGRFARLPFELVDEEPESGAYTFTLTLATELDDDGRMALADAMRTWSSFVLAGGFALAPIPPEENYVEPDDPFVELDHSVEWSVFKLRAHPAAVDALLNTFAAFHGRGRGLSAVTIS